MQGCQPTLQSIVLGRASWMGAHEVTEGQVPLHLRRARLKRMHLMSSTAVRVILSKVTPALDPKLPHHLIPQPLHLRGTLIQQGKVAGHHHHVDHGLGPDARHRRAADVMHRHQRVPQGIRHQQGFAGKLIFPMRIVGH